MTGGTTDGASDNFFFDDFNKDRDKQAVMEFLNRKLCEILTELAEEMVDTMAEAQRQPAADAGTGEGEGRPAAEAEPGAPAAAAEAGTSGAAAKDGDAEEEEDKSSGGPAVFDEVAAMAAYNDAMAAIMREKNVTSKDMCALPDDHPLKELFFSAFDDQMFHELLERFIGQVRSRKEGPGEWDAEAAEGECDEDHTLE
ncbi:hypothetical protein PLESTB_001719300 [Pleodorina starrii]|uniref:Uncharacterized protein n=1 Tax=Pleodorina starrii TaxID=330485 RepID=A0A9W6BZT1_9CHLO|nr:hypothetical protein PLESTM_001874600 [Pleodorina starrii]GLC61113.1 hypothetical protein PLESTB_001719300 [Pleodorina starrii]GLC69559.1 hypothetical protein PLESTF_000847300 [Pleodorina starrii]